MMLRIIIALALSELCIAHNNADAAGGDQVDHGKALVDWLRSNGGFFHPKIEIQQLDKNDPVSLGMFVTENIAEKETLMDIPQNCLLDSGGSRDMCDTARNLQLEMKRGGESHYAPYLNYLLDGLRGQLPSAWSFEGQEIIETLIGSEMQPDGVTDIFFNDHCVRSDGDEDGDEDDSTLQEDAYLFVVQRGWEDIMIPVFDMISLRNGHWKNVGSKNHEGGGITAFALRDIKAREQLYLSYSKCTECDGNAQTFVTQHILKEFGFKQQYPQRWFLHHPHGDDDDDSSDDDNDDVELIFELNEITRSNGAYDESGTSGTEHRLEIMWISEEPNTYELNELRGQLKRVRSLDDWVQEGVNSLESDYERSVIVDFYQALTTALELAILNADKIYTQKLECVLSVDGDKKGCDKILDDKDGEEEKELGGLYLIDYDASWVGPKYEYEEIDEVESKYQTMLVVHDDELSDTCFYLDEHLHVCAAFRPHYHELVVHYAARFLKTVRRVIFLGGGDSMLVHEILKYPELELVVGLELDQMVVRSSFKHFGSQPHFDDERVEWWFGDAAKSLRVIPEEYYGSFDLVIVDLALNLPDILKVTDDLTLAEVAALLLAPEGVIVRNEDDYENFYSGDPSAFTEYNVYLNYMSVPMYCHQSFSLGSNSVNFLVHTPIDHKIDTVFLNPVDEMDRFDMWYNYKHQDTTSLANKSCTKPGAEEKAPAEATEKRSGVLMIVEAEDADVKLDSSALVQDSLSQALKKADLTEIAAHQREAEGDGRIIVFILQEGYVSAQTWPEDKYCALDIMLWSDFEKHSIAETELLAAIGSDSSSSYRIVTGGMFGETGWKGDGKRFGSHDEETCESPVLQDTSNVVQSTIDAIVQESISLVDNSNAAIAILCGEKSSPCSSLTALSKEFSDENVIPVWACSGIDDSTGDESDASCLAETLTVLRRSVKAGSKKIGGILIDTVAPPTMGNVLERMFFSTKVRRELLEEEYVVLGAFLDEDTSWQEDLLEYFRTDIDKFDPVYRSNVSLRNATTSLTLGVFSSGDTNFYAHLVEVISRIEDKTELVAEVQDVRGGLSMYYPDFEPIHVSSHEDYDPSSALEQWLSQEPLGRQTIFVFSLPRVPANDRALFVGKLKKSLQRIIISMEEEDIDSPDVMTFDGVGEGCIILAFWSEANIILSWDGRDHVTLNLFADGDSKELSKQFEELFRDEITVLGTEIRDMQPRGFGRVVNFEGDVGPEREQEPHWALHAISSAD
uniref:PABS domain-containing protein n=1 Tax=Odontella aurita TaxID=265563 RepID=A0A7S4MRE5_9STRA|mmetsp:Transcript_29562/g.87570  ORF Transcript_29562/g.87570 Transcript_29562/m.87570 type:complete len:1250 (+) Transcript_29562:62-3811(+)